MKNKLLVTMLAVTFLSVYFVSDDDKAFASCGFSYPHLYWPYTPCHDADESVDEQKQDWANFYYFMGSKWMEQKTAEYETILHDSSLEEESYLKWVGDGPNYNIMHYNFAQYHKLFGGGPPVGIDLKPIEIPQQDQYRCDGNCLERLDKKGRHLCHQEYSGDHLCVEQSHVWTEISSTQTDLDQQTVFRPSEVTVSLGINNTIGWRNYGYVSSIASNSAMFAPIQVPFTDLSWLVIDKTGQYDFYDHTDPSVRVKVTVVPFDYNFEIGKPIEKSTSNRDVRYMVFRAPDAYNFVNGMQIVDQDTVNVFLDNTMNSEYAVNDFPVTFGEKQVSTGEKIVAGCTYHHDLYSRLFYLTLDNIDSENKFVEFKETTEFVSGDPCFDDEGSMDSNKLNKIQQDYSVSTEVLKPSSTEIKSPLKQFKLGMTLDEIQCKESLMFVTKYDGSPACVNKQSIPKLIQRGWAIANDENTSFEVITSESKLATFYAQPQITSVILKQDSTIRVHLFSYIKESGGWDMVFDRIFDEVPKNFRIGIVEDTPDNVNEFVLLGKENLPSGIKAELLREDGYFVVYLTSNKSLEPGEYVLSVVSVDDKGTVIQKPLFVIAVNADTASTQDSTVKIHHSNSSWGIDLENISEHEYWIREDRRSPWPPSPILNITQDNIHPDVKELIDSMWSENAKYVPSEYDKETLIVETDHNLNTDPQKIMDWLETTYVQQFKRNLDDSFSSYIKYDDKIYSFGFVITD